MSYYTDHRLTEIKDAIEAEIRGGVRNLRASYFVRKHHADPTLVQQVLSDLVAAGDLAPHYQVLCSGENQNYDVDREYEDRRKIPNRAVTCRRCGDKYTPSDDNILLSFDPTESYLRELTGEREPAR